MINRIAGHTQSGLDNGKIPNPESLVETVFLLRENSIVSDIKLDGNDQEAILLLMRERPAAIGLQLTQKLRRKPTFKEVSDEKTEFANKRIARIESVLDPRQRDRLKEIAYRFEIEKIGFANALADGFLSKRVVMSIDQKANLRIRAEAIESKRRESIAEVIERSQADLLKRLEPLQRVEADKVIGKPFAFRVEIGSDFGGQRGSGQSAEKGESRADRRR